jgi:glycosyltransferase involved in cell wall biosynthesis
LLGLAFSRARLRFHTAAERAALERAYRIRTRSALIAHADSVTVHLRLSREEARTRLGLEADGRVFVCAGFLHADKGFDRAVRAFARAGSPGALFVVGSVRLPSDETAAFVRELRGLCERTEGVTLIERFVSDDEFDLWMSAADRAVFPYRRAWSSGALARAQRLGVPALVAEVGGLPEQAEATDAVFGSDEELVRLFSEPDASRGGAGRHEAAL